MKKRILALLLAALTLLTLSGCGTKPTAQSAPAPEAPKVEKIRIALVLPATVDDLAWGQSMVEGLKAVQKTMGADKVEVAISEKLGNAVDAGSAIRQYATQGYDIILAHGSQYQSVLTEITKDFPKTTFAYGTGFATQPNVFAYDPQAQEGGYLLGMLAAMTTKSGIVGIVGPVESGDAVKYNYGVQQGVLKGKADVKTRTAYTGSFNDIVGAGNLAKTQMSAGADILTGSSQQAVGALRAVAETKDKYWLSTDMDQSSIAPDHVLAAQVYNWEKVVTKIIELRKKGTLGGQVLTLGFADGTIDLKYNAKLADKIPAAAKAAVEQAKQDIISGKLKVELPKK
ncbi:Nucleoside ABC transporter, periplasmic nucleoside-binding protein [Desulfosporosinus sp. I2]|uniref:BMP family lipoprotein n=1 Tax=Desulfosporosinus sp. I2 TaxID=1617025 RepID=UPI0005EF9BA7|nr:BMP family protein [Desulfosporosinus sp. I2]KJR46566.1 Nucleoside ABC transporter, periplasmic nucleoside-binding protein [Desulfosporosinus sp. I2]